MPVNEGLPTRDRSARVVQDVECARSIEVRPLRKPGNQETRKPGEGRENEATSPSFFSWIPGFLRGTPLEYPTAHSMPNVFVTGTDEGDSGAFESELPPSSVHRVTEVLEEVQAQ